MSKSFEVAVERAIKGEQDETPVEPLPFHFADDPETELLIYPIDESQMSIILSVTDGLVSGTTQISTFINLFMDLLDEESRPHVKRRLLSRTDKLSVLDLLPVIRWLVSEAAGRPTESSPTSSPSPASNGQRSTGRARRAGSTRSSSPSTDSSTSSTATSSKKSPTAKSSNNS